MPIEEAPIGLGESSPENSISAEFAAAVPGILPAPAAPINVQIRVHTPEPRHLAHESRQPNRRALPRLNSYDRDIPALEEDNHWPTPAVHLLPVNLPPQAPEPCLDELLRRVTGRTDLHNVDAVRLRVISYSVSLSCLSLFLPRLQHLDLNGSVLNSLRDLGYGLTQLSYLNVSNCGLNSFDGTGGLPAVRVLIADGNMIQRVGPLAELPLLQRLSAQQNRISDLGLLTFLGLCPNLLELELQGNPVCHLALYRVTLQRCVPSLQLLDGVPVGELNPAAHNLNDIVTIGPASTAASSSSTDAEVSSLSSDVYSESSNAAAPVASGHCFRPATAPNHECNNSLSSSNAEQSQRQRPATASLATGSRRNSLSMGAPVAGSVLSCVRNRQRNGQRPRRNNAWGSSSSSTTSTSSNASTRPPSASSNGSFGQNLPALQREKSSDTNDWTRSMR